MSIKMKVFCLNTSCYRKNKTSLLPLGEVQECCLGVWVFVLIWPKSVLISPRLHICAYPFSCESARPGKHFPFSRLWLNAEQPGFIFNQPLRGKQGGLNDVMISMWLTTEGDVEGSQQSVLSFWSHGSRETQLGHHVTEGWLRSSN